MNIQLWGTGLVDIICVITRVETVNVNDTRLLNLRKVCIFIRLRKSNEIFFISRKFFIYGAIHLLK